MAQREVDTANLQGLQDLDRLIHEPARLSIVALLYVVKSADFVFLQRQTGLTPGNLSAHLAKLEAAGYVEVGKEFVGKTPRTVASLTPEGRDAFRAYRRRLLDTLHNLPH